MNLTYFPTVFDAADLAAARGVVLTPEHEGPTTDDRWLTETPYLMGMISGRLAIGAGSVVLDYGCGVGRMSRALIEWCDCRVVGLDISPHMCRMADEYVDSTRFSVFSTIALGKVSEARLSADAAIAIWSLQHCFDPASDIARIDRCLRPGARGFVVNHDMRLVPALDGEGSWLWVNDGKDIRALLGETFDVVAEGRCDPVAGGNPGLSSAWWMVFRKRAA